MSPRRRSKGKPPVPNLYERKGYYTWRNPQTRDEFGLGRDKASAIAQAVEANIAIAKLTHKTRLVDRMSGSAVRSVGAWAEKYTGLQESQKLADNTTRSYASLSRRLVKMLGEDTPIRRVTALEVSELLENVVKEGKARTAQALRNYARDFFRESIVQGWRTVSDGNPVIETKLSTTPEVKRMRLAFDVFMQVYERARFPWLKNAMALALVSGQRREDVLEAKFSDFHDGGWWCVQQSEKSTHPHRIFIPDELRLEVFGMSLADVKSQCRRTGALSHYLIHQTTPRGNSPIGAQMWLDTLSKKFTETLEELEIVWPAGKTAPTFHEIRSLSERLYAAQGGVNTQHLLGHNDASTTAIYHDSRGTEWVHILDGK